MNFKLKHLPERNSKPRNSGITMMMDKGLSIKEVENFIETSADYTDLVKLGFGTSYLTKNLSQKIKLYQEAGIKVYVGGTLFEAFIIRNQFDDYCRFMDKFNLTVAEVSDGSVSMNHDVKCSYINKLSKNYTVLSEVGSKEEGIIIHPNKWIGMMKKELEVGSWKVIAEARESGNVGIYHRDGKTHTMLIDKIVAKINVTDIMWEAPIKSQQVWFIKNFGTNINLGNIGVNDVIPLETLRLGLRGDTFFTFLPKELNQSIETI
ncbi:MAG: phosphosulfolactate synthase [Bacteroidia bacterium]|nr:phosphosulfolactate synthase [Bacteroidia bacterium]MCZ2249812.1 phosphosulfolactate synthase [Bacteroidia bacterium]